MAHISQERLLEVSLFRQFTCFFKSLLTLLEVFDIDEHSVRFHKLALLIDDAPRPYLPPAVGALTGEVGPHLVGRGLSAHGLLCSIQIDGHIIGMDEACEVVDVDGVSVKVEVLPEGVGDVEHISHAFPDKGVAVEHGHAIHLLLMFFLFHGYPLLFAFATHHDVHVDEERKNEKDGERDECYGHSWIAVSPSEVDDFHPLWQRFDGITIAFCHLIVDEIVVFRCPELWAF